MFIVVDDRTLKPIGNYVYFLLQLFNTRTVLVELALAQLQLLLQLMMGVLCRAEVRLKVLDC
jgi:hypothetical protein